MPNGSRVRNGWTTVGRVFLFILICPLLLVLAGPLCSRLPGQFSQVALGSITTVATVIVTGLFLRWDKLLVRDIGVAPDRRSAIRMIVGFAFWLLLVALQTCFVMLAGHVHWVRTPPVGVASVGMALLAYGMLASREELAFRGYPLRRLDDRFGMWIAQLVVALVFAMEHVAGGATWGNAILGAFTGSLLFGMAALAMRGLACSNWLTYGLEFRPVDARRKGDLRSLAAGRGARLQAACRSHGNARLSACLWFGNGSVLSVWNFQTHCERKHAMEMKRVGSPDEVVDFLCTERGALWSVLRRNCT